MGTDGKIEGTQSVNHVPGCGPMYTKHFQNMGILTVHDLLEYTGSIPGIPVGKLQVSAENVLKNQVDNSHSWYGYVGYIYRSSGTIRRVVIGRCVVLPHRLVFVVTWQEGGRKHSKGVSAYQLLHNQFDWISTDIVSEDSDGEGAHTRYLTSCLPHLSFGNMGALHPATKQELNKICWEVQKIQMAYRDGQPPADNPRPTLTQPAILLQFSEHNWVGKNVHFVRARGNVGTGYVDSLVLTPQQVMVFVYWRTKGKIGRVLVDPISLLYQQCMWLKNDIVSDSDNEDSFSSEETGELPTLQIEEQRLTSLSEHQSKAVLAIVSEIKHLQKFIFSK